MSMQNDIDSIIDKVQRGLLSTDQANVEIVKLRRALMVTSRLPRDVRSALNAAVRSGDLCRMPKKGLLLEVFYVKDFKYMAVDLRNKYINSVARAVGNVCG